jgi:hypothetical protein
MRRIILAAASAIFRREFRAPPEVNPLFQGIKNTGLKQNVPARYDLATIDRSGLAEHCSLPMVAQTATSSLNWKFWKPELAAPLSLDPALAPASYA